jgi:hypothetical protein
MMSKIVDAAVLQRRLLDDLTPSLSHVRLVEWRTDRRSSRENIFLNGGCFRGRAIVGVVKANQTISEWKSALHQAQGQGNRPENGAKIALVQVGRRFVFSLPLSTA